MPDDLITDFGDPRRPEDLGPEDILALIARVRQLEAELVRVGNEGHRSGYAQGVRTAAQLLCGDPQALDRHLDEMAAHWRRRDRR